MVQVTIDCGRILMVGCIAFWELIASGLASLAMSQNWFDPQTRGIFIISFSSSTLIVRILQIVFYKCKLSSIASKKAMIIIEKRKLRKLRENNMEIGIEFGQNTFSDVNRSPIQPRAQLKFKHESHNQNNIDNNNKRTDNMYADDNIYPDNNMNNIEYNNKTTYANDENNNEIKRKEDMASDLMNYNFALYFISFSTFSDASFDIIQGIVLIFGNTTTTHPLAVIGSIIGFSTEVIDFFEEVFGFALAVCREFDAGDILENIWCITVSVGCMIEQAIAIYVIYFVFDCPQFLCSQQLLLLVIISLSVSVIGFIIGVVFLVYACTHRRVRISLDLSILKKDDLDKELEEVIQDNDNMQKQINQVGQSVTQLKKREDHLNRKIELCIKRAKAKSERRDKKGALFELKKKQQLENQLQSIQAKKLELETQIMELEDEHLDLNEAMYESNGLTQDMINNPFKVNIIVSFECISKEIENVQQQILRKGGKNCQDEQDRIQRLKTTKTDLETQISNGSLTLEQYTAIVKDAMIKDLALSKHLKAQDRKFEASKVFQRYKLMKKEIEGT